MPAVETRHVPLDAHAGGREPRVESLLRRGVLIVATATCLGLLVELGAERHWTQPVQLVAWGAVAATLVAVGLVWAARSSARVRLARVLAVVVIASAAFGVGAHVVANNDA